MDEVKNANGINYFKPKGAFQISVSPETFRMLARLYSNPVKAIVREYSTNARDSQVEAGVDRPFDVQLPTKQSPIFMIRDYGTGMSTERVETIFQTFGASTKRDTNQNTGKFGCGSKAALYYVDSFAVISYYQGKEHRYLVSMDENRIPELWYDGMPTDTDEPNGVKIQFGIESVDVHKFTTAAQEVYPYFEIQPNFIGDNKPVITKPTYVMEGDEGHFKWKVKQRKGSYRYDDQTHTQIIMGSNCYPLGEELRSLSDSGIDYYVDIDEFEPVPQRKKYVKLRIA